MREGANLLLIRRQLFQQNVIQSTHFDVQFFPLRLLTEQTLWIALEQTLRVSGTLVEVLPVRWNREKANNENERSKEEHKLTD